MKEPCGQQSLQRLLPETALSRQYAFKFLMLVCNSKKNPHSCQHQGIITTIHFTLNTEEASSTWLIPETRDLYSTAEFVRIAHVSRCVSLLTPLCLMVLHSGPLQRFDYAGFTLKKKQLGNSKNLLFMIVNFCRTSTSYTHFARCEDLFWDHIQPPEKQDTLL